MRQSYAHFQLGYNIYNSKLHVHFMSNELFIMVICISLQCNYTTRAFTHFFISVKHKSIFLLEIWQKSLISLKILNAINQ